MNSILLPSRIRQQCARHSAGRQRGGVSVSTDRIAADIRTVSSDAFLGCGPATPAEELTVNYIRDRLQTAGVQPGGPNGSWFRRCC